MSAGITTSRTKTEKYSRMIGKVTVEEKTQRWHASDRLASGYPVGAPKALVRNTWAGNTHSLGGSPVFRLHTTNKEDEKCAKLRPNHPLGRVNRILTGKKLPGRRIRIVKSTAGHQLTSMGVALALLRCRQALILVWKRFEARIQASATKSCTNDQRIEELEKWENRKYQATMVGEKGLVVLMMELAGCKPKPLPC